MAEHTPPNASHESVSLPFRNEARPFPGRPYTKNHESKNEIKAAISQVVATETEAAAQNKKTISLGQTPEEVEAILGKPDKIVNLGPKITFVYKDMKVIFQDGKVADVQ